MSTDRELLELAAKAAGIRIDFDDALPFGDDLRYFDYETGDFWNPLTDDGDALRLAVKLSMSLDVDDYEASTYAYAGKVPRTYAMELWRDDKAAATRRAIVRAAAEIGSTQ